jgi:hypothetical protein
VYDTFFYLVPKDPTRTACFFFVLLQRSHEFPGSAENGFSLCAHGAQALFVICNLERPVSGTIVSSDLFTVKRKEVVADWLFVGSFSGVEPWREEQHQVGTLLYW